MFQTDLVVRAGRESLWILERPLVWCGCESITVPVGFETDLASVPAALRSFMNPNGKSRKPAVLHDFLYSMQILSRLRADELFELALAAEGVNQATRFFYFRGVRLGGQAPWDQHRKELRHAIS